MTGSVILSIVIHRMSSTNRINHRAAIELVIFIYLFIFFYFCSNYDQTSGIIWLKKKIVIAHDVCLIEIYENLKEHTCMNSIPFAS